MITLRSDQERLPCVKGVVDFIVGSVLSIVSYPPAHVFRDEKPPPAIAP